VFSPGGNVFPHKNAIIKNTREKQVTCQKQDIELFNLKNCAKIELPAFFKERFAGLLKTPEVN
jgi:hypothetical protein